MLGAAFALAVYGGMRHSEYRAFYWPVVVGAFLCVSSGLHVVAHLVARGANAAECKPGREETGSEPLPALALPASEGPR